MAADQIIQEAYLTLTWVGLVAVTGGLGTGVVAILIASSNPVRDLQRLSMAVFAGLLLLMFLGLGGCGMTARDMDRHLERKERAQACYNDHADAQERGETVTEGDWKQCDDIRDR